MIGPGSDVDDFHYHSAATDGSIENELPMNQLSELFNVNHFIVSQVNIYSLSEKKKITFIIPNFFYYFDDYTNIGKSKFCFVFYFGC